MLTRNLSGTARQISWLQEQVRDWESCCKLPTPSHPKAFPLSAKYTSGMAGILFIYLYRPSCDQDGIAGKEAQDSQRLYLRLWRGQGKPEKPEPLPAHRHQGTAPSHTQIVAKTGRQDNPETTTVASSSPNVSWQEEICTVSTPSRGKNELQEEAWDCHAFSFKV